MTWILPETLNAIADELSKVTLPGDQSDEWRAGAYWANQSAALSLREVAADFESSGDPLVEMIRGVAEQMELAKYKNADQAETFWKCAKTLRKCIDHWEANP